jgi:hypothetical protein
VHYGAGHALERHGVITNVSERGVAISGAAYPVGTALLLVIEPADASAIEVQAYVAWSHRAMGRMGLQVAPDDAAYPAFLELAAARMSGERPAREQSPPPPGAQRPPPASTAPRPLYLHSPPVDQPSAAPPPDASAVPPEGSEPAPLSATMRARRTDPARVSSVTTRQQGMRVRMPRFEGAVAVSVAGAEDQRGRGFTTNVSRTGLALSCDRSYPKGTRVSLAINAGDDRVVQATGVVVRSTPSQRGVKLGLQIVDPDDSWIRFVDDVAHMG